MMDPVSGYWQKSEEESDEGVDPTASPRQRIVPSVQDRKNALLLKPANSELSQKTLTTVQHALLRGIEAVFQLEESEILAEPMPTREERAGFLFYEATEGGAGVLTRLVSEPDRLAEVALKALEILHFDLSGGLPVSATGLSDVSGTTCVAACYRCVMSYYNQPDHEQLERRDADAQGLLIRLAKGRIAILAAPTPRRATVPPPLAAGDDALVAWLAYAGSREIPTADSSQLMVETWVVPLVWRSHYVAALVDENPALALQLEDKGFAVVVLGRNEAEWSDATTRLAALLGRPE